MKKLLGMALCLALLLGALPGGAEGQNAMLQGVIGELGADNLVLSDHKLGEVVVQIAQDTQLETEDRPLEAGQYVFVEYDGKMTRSLPPQITARAIRMFSLSGEVQQVEEGKFLLMCHHTEEMVWVMMPEGVKVFAGDIVVAYYDGKMAKSSPAQVSALHVEPTTVSGQVQSVGDEAITLMGDDGSEYVVNLFEKTVMEVTPQVGERVTVHYNGTVALSMPPQIAAIALVKADDAQPTEADALPEEAEDTATPEQGEDGKTAEPAAAKED